MKKAIKGLALGAVVTGLAACSGGGGSSDGGSTVTDKTVSVKGQFDPAELPGAAAFSFKVGSQDVYPFGAGVTNEIYCQTLSMPTNSAAAVIGTNGAFSLSLKVPDGHAMGCFLVTKNGATIQSWIAVVSAVKESASGSGSVGQAGFPVKDDATEFNFGEIAVTNNNGVVTVSAPAAASNGSSALPSFASMTGEWKITSVAEGNGYRHPCDMEDMDAAGVAACKTRWANEAVYIHTFKASKAADSRDNIALWQTKADFDVCGTEGLTFGGGWDTQETKVKGSLPALVGAIDWTKIADVNAVLPYAKFSFSYEGAETNNNCPYKHVGAGDSDAGVTAAAGKTLLETCKAAKTCADFTYTNDVDGTKAKIQCLADSMRANTETGFAWKNTAGEKLCGRRLEISAFDFMADVTSTAGCDNAGCGVLTQETNFRSEPVNRHFISELLTSGNLGSGTTTELDKQKNYDTGVDYYCYMNRELSFQITQNSATNATFALTINVYPKTGTIQVADYGVGEKDPNADNGGDAGKPWFDSEKCMTNDWIAEEMSAPMGIRLTLQKK